MKERNQRPVIGDTIRLKFFVFNGKNYAKPHEIKRVEIYKLFSLSPTDENQLGRQLVATIESENIVEDETGKYHIEVALDTPTFTQGRFQDEWHVVFEENTEAVASPMDFTIFPNAWFTDTKPIVHDFSFHFTPNRIVHGSKKYIQIFVQPNVPRGSDKQRYYENLISAGDMYVSMEMNCGECVPQEKDLRTVIDRELVVERDGCVGYFWLDTSELDCGIYDLQFEVELGPHVFISDKQQIQIYR